MIMSVSGKKTDFSEEILQIPSVTSLDPNERKLARRLRIQRRQEILSKRGAGEGEEIIEETPLENQIFTSADVLEKLETEGIEVVTSVKIANDAREVQRRKEEQKIKNKLLEKLAVENEECTRHYQKISDKWMSILTCNDPLDIHAEMELQNQQCLEVLSKKDVVISELKEVLKEADLQYEEDQNKQNEDIDILIERIENQINVMAKAYCHELLLIDSVIDAGCRELLTTVATKWETLYKKLRESSCEGVQRRKEIMKEYEDELEKLMIQHQEEYRAQKIRLELENQRIQKEVQYMKALCMLNTQKLDYSYSVLKLREDENSIIKGQQKRRINKLQDVINKLKKDYSKLEESSRSQIQKLTDQVLKIHANIFELQNKSDHFTQVNDKKYLQVWDMNANNAKNLIDEILNADKQICKEILGLEWQPPQHFLLMKEDLPSYCDIMAKIKTGEEKEEKKELRKSSQIPSRTNEEISLERNLLKHILKQISAQTGYLIEDGLRELLMPYTGNDDIIIRLDNIFRALSITSEDDMNYLLKFFLPYSFCPICTVTEEPKAEIHEKTVSLNSTSSVVLDIISENIENKKDFCPEEMKLISAVKQELYSNRMQEGGDVCFTEKPVQKSMPTTETSDNDVKGLFVHRSVSSDVFDDDTSQERHDQVVCERGHLFQIKTSHVTRALKEFVESYHGVVCDGITSTKNMLLDNKIRVCSRALTSADISKFWQSYRDIFPEKREKVWDALLIGLQKYYQVLKERQHLSSQTQNLRKQNGELRRLLKGCSVNVSQYYNSDTLH